MCGRYTVRDPRRCFAEFSIVEKEPALEPRYNVAPTQGVWAIRVLGPDALPRLDLMRWGLLAPHRPDSAGIIMARVETIATRAPFADAFRSRRCLLVADGFYEWKRTGSQSFPYYIRQPDGGPFAIAAIWEPAAATGAGLSLDTCAIITRPARPPIDVMHHRMPAIVDPSQRDMWLDPAYRDVAALKNLLLAGPNISLVIASVSSRVNSPAHDDPDCVTSIPETERHGEQFELWPSAAPRRTG